jgi:DNA-binding NarL/FixJ family response regulator
LRLLIAEDSDALRERLVEMCSAIEGVAFVDEVRDVAAAVATLEAVPPDLVILDTRVGGGSGINLLRTIKQKCSATTIILTNHSDTHYRQKCGELGADYFLCKSTDSKLLIEIVERLASASFDE